MTRLGSLLQIVYAGHRYFQHCISFFQKIMNTKEVRIVANFGDYSEGRGQRVKS